MPKKPKLPPETPDDAKKNIYDDGNIPEIDLPGKSDATIVVPKEMPQKNNVAG